MLNVDETELRKKELLIYIIYFILNFKKILLKYNYNNYNEVCFFHKIKQLIVH